jgi:TctA family transporter
MLHSQSTFRSSLQAFQPEFYVCLIAPFMQHASCPTQPTLLGLIITVILDEEYKLWISSLCIFVQPPVTSFFFGPYIYLNTLLSNTLNLCSSLNMRDQI